MSPMPTDAEIDAFAQRLQAGGPFQAGDAAILKALVATVTAQADAVARLSMRLDVANAFASVATDIVASSGIAGLARALGNPQRNDFTVEEARGRIDNLLQEIQQQTQVTEVLGTILKFAVKFAPLLLA